MMRIPATPRGNFSAAIKDSAAGIERQRGATLLVALIMLVLLTLVAVSAVNSTTGSIRVVGNSQFSGEAEAVAQQGIEWIISSNFTASPAASSVAVDVNNDGTPDYTAEVAMPDCLSSVPLTNAELNPFSAADSSCVGSGAAQNAGIISASGIVQSANMSWCYNQTWDIQSTVTDNSFSGASRTQHQGVALRVPAGTACP